MDGTRNRVHMGMRDEEVRREPRILGVVPFTKSGRQEETCRTRLKMKFGHIFVSYKFFHL